MDDALFRALNDPSRRLLLDRLFERDGQTLRELCAHLPDMTRYGVMNHLAVLERAGLVATAKVGRNKHHYLNAVPIQLVHDRWINKYTKPQVQAVVDLTRAIQRGGTVMSKPDHVYEAFIQCSPEAAWQAMVDGDQTARYFYNTRVEADWKAGSPIRYLSPDGQLVADGELLVVDEPKTLEMSFHPRWDPELEAEGPVRVAWRIEPADGMAPGSIKLRVEFYDMPDGGRIHQDFVGGIPYIVSGMKTLLETGSPLGG